MPLHTRWNVEVDEHGRLVIPAGAAEALGLTPGARTFLETDGDDLRLLRPVTQLARIYIEPTSACNFDCRTCMRNVWDEPPGMMPAAVFERVLEGVRGTRLRPLVFFGGYGEPLYHPHILEMLRTAKQTGAKVEMISNGSLLDETTARQLIAGELDRLWVSLDGATRESYSDVRLGYELPGVIENLTRLRQLRARTNSDTPRLGIAFVAMKRNIADLPEVVRLGRSLGADRFSISNVLAHTADLRQESLYDRSMYEMDQPVSEWSPLIDLPRLDVNALTKDALVSLFTFWQNLAVSRQQLRFGANTCPFVQKGSLSVRWDGKISPCLPLLHSHSSYLDNHERRSAAYFVGDLNERSLPEIWTDPAYVSLREKLQLFDFSPCVFCNACAMAEQNQEDCFGNTAPACGGCLWAQGLIQCP